jgi:mannose-6-phosphate isomerase-like protein (cupin superfamily)
MSERVATVEEATDRSGFAATSERMKFLLFGHDTVECSYYAIPTRDCKIDFDRLGASRESLRLAKDREPREVELGGAAFLLHPFGTNTGYPFVLSNQDMTINCGPNNRPGFFVKYHSGALWREGIARLHNHSGEEYVYVLEGRIKVHTEFYDPVELNAGESIYIDSNMGHAYVTAAGCEEATVLAVCSSADESLMESPLSLHGEAGEIAAATSRDSRSPSNPPAKVRKR